MSRTVQYKRYYCAVCYRSLSALQPAHEDEFEPCDGCGESGKWVPDPLQYIDEVWTKGTHIVFRNMGTTPLKSGGESKTNVYHVTATADNFPLGRISWFPRWRKYVFQPTADTVYEETCLREIALFIQLQTKLQVKKAAERRKKEAADKEAARRAAATYIWVKCDDCGKRERREETECVGPRRCFGCDGYNTHESQAKNPYIKGATA